MATIASAPPMISLNIKDIIPTITMWREASGEGIEGMLAVGLVIRNRALYRKLSFAEVCLQPYQFSSMTEEWANPALRNLINPALLRWPKESDTSFKLAVAAWYHSAKLVGSDDDPTDGADYYYADTIFPPAWAKDYQFTAQIGHHRFYRSPAATRLSAGRPQQPG